MVEVGRHCKNLAKPLPVEYTEKGQIQPMGNHMEHRENNYFAAHFVMDDGLEEQKSNPTICECFEIPPFIILIYLRGGIFIN